MIRIHVCTVYFAVKQFCMSRVKRPHQCMFKERRTSPWVEICPLARIQEYQRWCLRIWLHRHRVVCWWFKVGGEASTRKARCWLSQRLTFKALGGCYTAVLKRMLLYVDNIQSIQTIYIQSYTCSIMRIPIRLERIYWLNEYWISIGPMPRTWHILDL